MPFHKISTPRNLVKLRFLRSENIKYNIINCRYYGQEYFGVDIVGKPFKNSLSFEKLFEEKFGNIKFKNLKSIKFSCNTKTYVETQKER